ncbi:hypothetical protein Tco_1562067 [Tanacetum coccineum]
MPPITFPRRLRKEKEDPQQKKFLENLKQLYINLPFIEALAQMPKYAKFLKDDECYGIDDLDDTINAEAQKLLANEEPNSFLSRGLEKSIDQSDLEGFMQEIAKPVEVEREHLYSASANKIHEKKLELKDLPHHLEYAYVHGDKSFPIIISSELSKKEKMSLLQVLEKRKGAIA